MSKVFKSRSDVGVREWSVNGRGRKRGRGWKAETRRYDKEARGELSVKKERERKKTQATLKPQVTKVNEKGREGDTDG